MIKIDFTNVMSDFIGEKHGILFEEIEAYKEIVKEVHEKIKEERDNSFYFTKLPYQHTEEIKKLAIEIRENFDYFVVIGIGGSALGNQMIQEAINGFNYNNFNYPKFYIMDNVDPEKIGNILDLIDIRKTMFNVITKSGSTVETIANFAIVLTTLKDKLGEGYKNHLIFTTDPEKGFLRKFGEREGIKMLDIPPKVGGRFSVLSNVGLLSSAVCGIDIDLLLEGARKADELCMKISNPLENPAYLIGLIHYLACERKGKHISVMMPYFERLSSFVDWYRQLWAESLGKEGFGQTPLKSIGTIDQHSQIQLFRESPKDKIITFLRVLESSRDYKIPKDIPEEIGYLANHSLKEILDIELEGTIAALIKSQVPNLTITIDRLNHYNLGMLIYIYELATGFTGMLYKINPFDQPAVEEGKDFAYGLMGRKGYEKKLEEYRELVKEKYTLEIND